MENPFITYASNTAAGTANSYILSFERHTHFSARCSVKVTADGGDRWRFWFHNDVFSTFAQGKDSWANRPGGAYRILSASVADLGTSPFGEPIQQTAVTFDGQPTREVAPSECFWSDPVPFSIPAGHFLRWEWELDGNWIPCSTESQIYCETNYGDGFHKDDACPKPVLFACNRPIQKRVAFCGDSITQGVCTTPDAYRHWVARIADYYKDTVSVWNLGLGYGRGMDFATCQNWLETAANVEHLFLAYGVNDLIWEHATADILEKGLVRSIEALLAKGCKLTLITTPPFNLEGNIEKEWRAFCARIPKIAAKYGLPVFDFTPGIVKPAPNDNLCIYGGHPNDEGCAVIAERFCKSGLI